MLEKLAAFLCLGLTVSFNSSSWRDLYGNLRKEQRLWRMVAKLLTNMGATVRHR